jgi:hypothetical protein
MSHNPLRHAVARMGGRDPHELHRTATLGECLIVIVLALASIVIDERRGTERLQEAMDTLEQQAKAPHPSS